MADLNEYLNNITPSQRKEYERIRAIVKKMVPDAEETISYGIPTFKHNGKYVIYFAAYKSHMSVHPGFKDIIDSVKDKLGDFVITKETRDSRGTVQFTEDNPIPEVLVRAIIQRALDRQ
jgi:uncharacterized protein YdhG (YjbR/CyaY superfamily)